MSTLTAPRVAAAVFAVLLAATAAGCGDSTDATDRPAGAATATGTPDPSAADAAADGDWLLRFTTAEGADGEQSRSIYVRYNPTTGAATARTLPALTASDASADEQVLLVSADHTRAIPDTSVPADQAATGRLLMYSLNSDATETLDIRAVSGKAGLKAVAWAFDPTAVGVLRVVDSDQIVWKVDLATRSAVQESRLPERSGWIFGNGFDKNSGEPYIESIDSDQTEPAGNGDSDSRPVERQGGTLVRYDGEALDGLPKPPCGFAGGFQFTGGTAWLFCADTPSITAYQAVTDGTTWHQFGAASTDVVPGVAAELSFALPPVH
jgi:hypothetical protein